MNASVAVAPCTPLHAELSIEFPLEAAGQRAAILAAEIVAARHLPTRRASRVDPVTALAAG